MSEILYTLQCYLQVFKYMTFVNVFSIYVLMSNRIEMFSKNLYWCMHSASYNCF